MKLVGTAKWLVVASAAVGSLYAASPALRAVVWRNSHNILGWTESARQADPEGFARYVETKLRTDLDKLASARRQLTVEVGSLAKQQKGQAAMLARAERFAHEFREAYRTAKESNGFPVTVHDARYSVTELEQQVSLLLAEASGCRRNLERLQSIREQAERRLENLAVRITRTESQLAAVATQRRLLRARVLTVEAEELVAQVDALFDRNRVVLHENPVRTVRELIASTRKPGAARPSLEEARRFLAATARTATATLPIAEASAVPQRPAKPTLRAPHRSGKPIFQQD